MHIGFSQLGRRAGVKSLRYCCNLWHRQLEGSSCEIMNSYVKRDHCTGSVTIML